MREFGWICRFCKIASYTIDLKVKSFLFLLKIHDLWVFGADSKEYSLYYKTVFSSSSPWDSENCVKRLVKMTIIEGKFIFDVLLSDKVCL
jgi:hypothetical protein